MKTLVCAVFLLLFSITPPARAATVVVEQVSINSGADTTFSINTSVYVSATPGAHIRFAPAANMENASAYTPYNAGATHAITLSPGAGNKSVCVQAKDPASGEESAPVCDTINLQLYGPNYPTNISVRINEDALTTTSREVSLILTGNNVAQIAISNSNNFSNAQWMPYARVKQWFLTGGTGYKEVYVLFASGNGTLAQAVGDNIEYVAESTAPDGEIVIEDGLTETPSIDVRVKVRNVVGADMMRLATQADMSDAIGYEPVTTWKSFTLTPGIGVKRVCAQFKNDGTGAVSVVDCDTIILTAKGASAPTAATVKIENGAKQTLDSAVDVTFKALNANRMAISNYADFKQTAWRPFSATLSWNLLSGKGERTIFVMFASPEGHVTDPITQEIEVQTSAPSLAPIDQKKSPAAPAQPRALPGGVTPGMLVKQFARADVYYIGRDGYRYVFPSSDVFLSWYSAQDLRLAGDGGKVVTLAASTLSSIPIGGNVTFRPGTTLVKIPSDPRVYAVDERGTLRWVTSAQVATNLFGTLWSKQVKDVPESLFVNYGTGENINSEVDFKPDIARNRAKTIADDKQLATP